MLMNPDIRMTKLQDLHASGLLKRQFFAKLLPLIVKSLPGEGCGTRVHELGIAVPPVNPEGIEAKSPVDS
jgi:hypothetical protein